MPHLFYDLDFTVSVFVVHLQQVLLVHHRKLEKWLPVGGHIEIGENPEAAAKREAFEESGLEIERVGPRPRPPRSRRRSITPSAGLPWKS